MTTHPVEIARAVGAASARIVSDLARLAACTVLAMVTCASAISIAHAQTPAIRIQPAQPQPAQPATGTVTLTPASGTPTATGVVSTAILPILPAGTVAAQPVAGQPVAIQPAATQPPAGNNKPAGAKPSWVAAGETPTADKPTEPTEEEKAAAAEAAEKAKNEQIKQQRLQKIAKLTFDRRPSTIFKLWANPEDEDDDTEDGDAANDKTAAAAAGSADAASRLETLGYAISGTAISGTTITVGPTTITSGSTSSGGSFVLEYGGIELPEGMSPEMLAAGAGANPSVMGAASAEPDPFDKDLELFQSAVTLGEWDAVRAFLHGIDEDLGKAAYKKMLDVLKMPPRPDPKAPPQARNPMFAEKNIFSVDDVLGMIAAAPVPELDDDYIGSLGAIVKLSVASGSVVEGFVSSFRTEVNKPEDEATLARREAAKILFGAGEPIEAGTFLPRVDEAAESEDHEALNLLAEHHMALYADDSKPEHLEDAWRVLQALFVSTEIEDDEKDRALQLAVELAPKVEETLGLTWLEESFTTRPQRGMEIIAAIGAASARGFQLNPTDGEFRLKGLELQKIAVEALLEAAPERAQEWRYALSLLANNWLREAVHSLQFDESTSYGPSLQRDAFGNFFYMNRFGGSRGRTNAVAAIPTGTLLDARPADSWLALIDESSRPKYAMTAAKLFLKVNEEDAAFPYIEQLASTHPQQAEELANEFIRVWTNNHDPNANRNRTNYYMFMYGFDRKAESIPLTRSKQERNLDELAHWVDRLQALPIDGPDIELLSKAFTTCHSSAEVYRLEAIEKVFGRIDDLDDDTLAEMIQRMRLNLASIWRRPDVQDEAKTKRRRSDIEAEVVRGYQVARAVLEGASARYPDSWAIALARAAIDHDQVVYEQDIAKSAEFSRKRQQAFAHFARAADLYANTAPTLSEDEWSTKVYDQWFYAALGAVDLQLVDQKRVPALDQIEKIRKSLLSLPGQLGEKHLAMFANALFTRMSSANPAVKARYLRAGFDIVGDHKRAHEARKVYDYYNDLVTEIRLEARLDGSSVVGHSDPFGMFIDIVHTREIERESGGFGRYLQNQNNSAYSYNYGRPTEDYRDKFQQAAEAALEEHFEVLSVTFESPKVTSRAGDEYGWRVTPYAYLTLRARGPEVDAVPPVQLDLDFLDTSGYVVLPIETAVVPIDASTKQGDPRPFEGAEITQILDERQADEGKLILEVKATGRGLAPKLETLVDLDPGEFEVVETSDDGVAPSHFDEESTEPAVVSERRWLVELKARDDLEDRPTTFSFAAARADDASTIYQRYVDADLVPVERVVDLDETYGDPRSQWALFVALGFIVASAAGLLLFMRRLQPATMQTGESLGVPETLTPFTVLGFLRDIERNNGLDPAQQRELERSIHTLEQRYFRDADETTQREVAAGDGELRSIAETWARHTLASRN